MQYVKIKIIVALLAIFWLLQPDYTNAQAVILYENQNYLNATGTTGSLNNWGNFNLDYPGNWINDTSKKIYLSNLALKIPNGIGNNFFISIVCEVIGGGGPFERYRYSTSSAQNLNIGSTNFTYHNFELSYTGVGANCDPNGIWRIQYDGNFSGSQPYIYTMVDNSYKIAVGISQEDYLPPFDETATYFISTEISTTTGTVTASGHIGTQWPNSYVDFSQDNILYGNWVNISLFREQTGFFTAVFNYNPITSTSTEGFNSQIFNLSIKNYTGCESGFGQDLSCPPGQPILASTSTNLVLDPNENPAFWGSPDFFAGLLPEVECSIFSGDGVMACFRNFSIWAFSMSSSSAYKYDELKTLVSTKYPLAPLVYVGQQISSFNASSTPTESFLIPDWIKTNIVDPMRTGLGILLVGFHLLVLYRWGHKINFT